MGAVPSMRRKRLVKSPVVRVHSPPGSKFSSPPQPPFRNFHSNPPGVQSIVVLYTPSPSASSIGVQPHQPSKVPLMNTPLPTVSLDMSTWKVTGMAPPTVAQEPSVVHWPKQVLITVFSVMFSSWRSL